MSSIMKNQSSWKIGDDEDAVPVAVEPEVEIDLATGLPKGQPVKVEVEDDSIGVAVATPVTPAAPPVFKGGLMPKNAGMVGKPKSSPQTGTGTATGTAASGPQPGMPIPRAPKPQTTAATPAGGLAMDTIVMVAKDLNDLAIQMPPSTPMKVMTTIMKASVVMRELAAGKGIDLVAATAAADQQAAADAGPSKDEQIASMQSTIDQLTATVLAFNAMLASEAPEASNGGD